MAQIIPAYGHPKETVTAMMMLYRNRKVEVRSPDGDKLQHCCQSNLPRQHTLNADLIKEKGFTLKKDKQITGMQTMQI